MPYQEPMAWLTEHLGRDMCLFSTDDDVKDRFYARNFLELLPNVGARVA